MSIVVRSWRGATRAEDADTYLEYLERTGLAAYRATPGNLGVLALRRVRDGKAEFHLLSFWPSMETVRAFAGEAVDRAVFYPEDDRFLIERDTHVDHYELVHHAGLAIG